MARKVDDHPPQRAVRPQEVPSSRELYASEGRGFSSEKSPGRLSCLGPPVEPSPPKRVRGRYWGTWLLVPRERELCCEKKVHDEHGMRAACVTNSLSMPMRKKQEETCQEAARWPNMFFQLSLRSILIDFTGRCLKPRGFCHGPQGMLEGYILLHQGNF